jgi:hypothetical protein
MMNLASHVTLRLVRAEIETRRMAFSQFRCVEECYIFLTLDL